MFVHRHYDSDITQSDATIKHNAAQRENEHADALSRQYVGLNATIQQKRKELEQIHANQGFAITTDMKANQKIILNEILFLQQKLKEVHDELTRAQNVVNARAAQIEDRREWNRDQQQQVAAAAAAAKDEAIDADRREKIRRARVMYDKELQQYKDAVRYVNVHQPKGWGWASFLPSFPFAFGSKIPEWQLTGDEDETEINGKESLLNAEIQKYYEANPVLKGIPFETLQAVRPQPPRASSPLPGRGGKSKRRTKKGKGKGKGKNARPCRRSTCRH
jgi:hypothetical protein